MENYDDMLKTMGNLNEILHKAFENITDIKIDEKKMIIKTKNCDYWFFKEANGWVYDGWEIRTS